MKSLRSTVSDWHGAPTLHINDQPDTGLMLYHNTVERGHEEMADFACAGIHLLTTGVGSVGCLREDGTLDTAEIDRKMALILAADPEALVLTRLSLHPPQWWVQRRPEHMLVHFDPYLDAQVSAEWTSPAFASACWRAEMGGAMQQVICYCEERYGEHFLGYHLCAGDCGEWSYAWRHYTQSDYSPVQRVAYQQWLQQRYQGDVALLSQRWHQPAASFTDIEIPRDWRYVPGKSYLLDPGQDQALIDYLTFHSEVVADAIVDFAQLAKAQLHEMEREKVVAVFYGYHFPPPGQSSALCNSGHHALQRVLASPDVDIICAPYTYYNRQAGGTFFSQLIAGSVRLHGKLFYSEDDTVTHVVEPHPYRYNCPDLFASKNVLLRNVLGALRDGGTSWYMDWFGGNWYRDEALMASIAATQRLAQQRLRYDNASAAQIAVFVSEWTPRHIWHDNTLFDAWSTKQLPELWALGAPIDVFELADLPLLLQQANAEQYRLLVFLDVPTMSKEECRLLREMPLDGRTLLWSYAPGIVNEVSLSTEAVSSVTGFNIRSTTPGPLKVETSYTGEALVYGVDDTMNPVLAGDDPTAEILGNVQGTSHPGLLRRRTESGTAIWSAAPLLPAALLRAFARDAGVHLYTDAGDQVLAERQLLTLHAASDGERRIKLPHPCTVVEAFTGAVIGEGVSEFSVVLREGETRVWKLA